MTRDGIETKSFQIYEQKVDGNSITGIASVFGNVDSYNDIIHYGSFRKSIKERGRRIRHLWSHDFWSPPTAKITSLREIKRKDLPEEILEWDEEKKVTGGLEVTRKYLDTPRGSEILEAIKAGALNEMSFAFRPTKFDFENIGTEENPIMIRNIREVILYETSDVNLGANELTIGSSGKSDLGMFHLKNSIQDVIRLIKLFKEFDIDLMDQIRSEIPEESEAEPNLFSLTSIERRILEERINLAMMMEVM